MSLEHGIRCDREQAAGHRLCVCWRRPQNDVESDQKHGETVPNVRDVEERGAGTLDLERQPIHMSPGSEGCILPMDANEISC